VVAEPLKRPVDLQLPFVNWEDFAKNQLRGSGLSLQLDDSKPILSELTFGGSQLLAKILEESNLTATWHEH
jgi:hypothetical protein